MTTTERKVVFKFTVPHVQSEEERRLTLHEIDEIIFSLSLYAEGRIRHLQAFSNFPNISIMEEVS